MLAPLIVLRISVAAIRLIGEATPADKAVQSNTSLAFDTRAGTIDSADQLFLVLLRRFPFGGSKGNAVRDSSLNNRSLNKVPIPRLPPQL